MCSHNTINDEEEKFVSLDETFVDEEDGRSGPSEVLLSKDKALKDLLHETDLPQSLYSLQNEISIKDISLSPEATRKANYRGRTNFISNVLSSKYHVRKSSSNG